MKKCIHLFVSDVLIVAMALCLTACGGTETSTESLPAVTDTPAEAAESPAPKMSLSRRRGDLKNLLT